eukprot:221391_1
MAYEESDDAEDSDYEHLSVPLHPPEKPSNTVQLYVQHNKGQGRSEEELRINFNENLGKQERQKWKTKHRKAKKRYHKLLQLYMNAHPEYDPDEHRVSSPAKRSLAKRNTNNTSSRKRPRANPTSSRARYVGIETYGDDNDYNQSSKRRRKQPEPITGNSIDELFRDISSGTKRVIRDPDKFKPSDINKIQMLNLVESMRDAARKDWLCNKEQKPAINTSLMLDVVVSELSKKLFYKYYLDDTDILEALRDWIHPLPDGSLPALKIRTECYRIIEKLQLHEYDQNSLEHYLQVSEDNSKNPQYMSDIHPNVRSFSKTCMYLWANKKETHSNKQLLRKIMERWIRTLTGSDSTYSDLREEMRESQQSIQERYRILQRQKRDFNFGISKRARIPEKPWHDFATNPANLVDEDLNVTRGGFSAPSHPLQDRMNKTFKRTTTSKQAARP